MQREDGKTGSESGWVLAPCAAERLLHAVVAVRVGLADACPRRDRLRRLPAQVADGRRGKRNPLERDDPLGRDAFELARVDLHAGRAIGGDKTRSRCRGH